MASKLAQGMQVPPPAMSEAEADRRFAQDQFDIVAIGAKADHRFRSADHRAAGAFYALAVRIAGERGVRDRLSADTATHAAAMQAWLARQFSEHLEAAVSNVGGSRDNWPTRFQQAFDILLGRRPRDATTAAYPQLPQLFFYPGLPQVDVADPDAFPWRERLEAQFPQMREEAVRLLSESSVFSPYVTKVANRPQVDTHRLLENPDWSSLYLWQNGQAVSENAERCPTIFRALTDNVPLFDVAGRSPSAYLSLLKPSAHIPTHTGMLNCRYICHLPLIVPPNCRLRVGPRTVEWQEGKLLVFDDTVEHEAWNRGSEKRLILLFEVWVPDLSETEKSLIRALLEAVDSYGTA